MHHTHSEPELASPKDEYGSVPHRNIELNHSHDQMIDILSDAAIDSALGNEEGESNHVGKKVEYSDTDIKINGNGEDGPLSNEAKHSDVGENGEDSPLLDEDRHNGNDENGKNVDNGENGEDWPLLEPLQLTSSKAEYGSAPPRNTELNDSHDKKININLDNDRIKGTDDGERSPVHSKDEYGDTEIRGDSEDGEDRPLLNEGKYHGDGENGEDKSPLDKGKYHGDGEAGEDRSHLDEGKYHGDGDNGEDGPLLEPPLMSKLSISAIVSTAFSYGCIISTLFLLTLPIECQRIELESTKYHMHSYTIHKSMALGGFAAIAGVTQLVTPIVGMLSDHYDPMTMIPKKYAKAAKLLGRRLPYLLLGSSLAVVGAVGQFYASNPIHRNQVLDPTGNDIPLDGNPVGVGSTRIYPKTVMLGGAWMEYTIFFSLCMIGINVVYTVMIALIPDLVPPSQTGVANGSLALMIVLGSLFGFGMYYEVLDGDILNMYKMYAVVAFTTGFISYASVCNRTRILQQLDIMNASMKVEDDKDDMEKNQPYEANIRHFTQSERIATNRADMKVEDGKDDTEKCQIYEANNVQRVTPSKRSTTDQVDIGQSEAQTSIGSPQQEPNERSSDEEFFSIFDIPSILVALFYEPIRFKSQSEIFAAYWIDISEHHDFFIVTISRFFYYMGVSSQTFFLYFIHDVLTKTEDTAYAEDAVAALAIVGQIAGAITCYPIGIISDKYFGGRRKPFVFFSCFCLSLANIFLLFCTSFQQMIWVSTFSGAANGMYLTMDTSLAVDTLETASDDDESAEYENELSGLLVNEKSSKSKENNDDDHDGAAQLLGVWGVCGFVGSASGPVIGGIVLLLAGRNNLEPSQFYSMRGYEGVFLLSAFYYFCSAISLAFVRKKGV